MVVSTVSSVSTDLFGSPGYQPWTWPHLATRSWWGRFLPEPARLSHTQSSILLTQTKQYNGWMQNYQNYQQIIRLFKFFQAQRLRLLVLKKVVHPQKKKNVYAVFREQQLNRAGCLSADSFAVALDQKHSWPEQGPMNKSAPWLGGYSPVKKIWKIHVHSGFFIDFP